MLARALRGMAQRRLGRTAVAGIVGVAMISSTYVQTNRIHAGFGDLERTTR